MRFAFHLDGRLVEYDVEGESDYGPDTVLLDNDDNLIAATPWSDAGYTVAPFLNDDIRARLVHGISALVRRTAEAALGRDLPTFTLETYHQLVTDDVHHQQIVRTTFHGRNAVSDLPIDASVVVRRISDVCGVDLTLENPDRPACFNVRICRPRTQDNNPLHRDAWLDRLRHAVNIYVPIAGSNSRSSLALVPGSHRWKESEIRRTVGRSRVNSVIYSVPTVVGTRRALALIRPNPGSAEVLVFSPYLIHGGSVNFDPDQTRVSLEMRFRRL